jgi:hypothetical protein
LSVCAGNPEPLPSHGKLVQSMPDAALADIAKVRAMRRVDILVMCFIGVVVLVDYNFTMIVCTEADGKLTLA